jgi:purine-binding chemotaxis protein CheW
MSTPQAAPAPDVLVVRIGPRSAALPLGDVVEISRPLPVQPVGGTPPYVLGLAVLRGSPAVVVDLRLLLGDAEPPPAARWVTVRLDGRATALAVDEVAGTRTIDPPTWGALPALAEGESLAAVTTVDRALVLLLRASRRVQEAVETAARAGGAGR